MKQSDVIAALAALAQDSRLAIYRLLVKRGPEGYAAGEIGERLKIAGPSLSFHLKELAHAGLVTARKDGRFIFYSAHFERMNDLVGYLTENCCSQGAVCAPVCAPNNAIERKRKSAIRTGPSTCSSSVPATRAGRSWARRPSTTWRRRAGAR
jgi:DNA-binding transcriptional ArsR family regulator